MSLKAVKDKDIKVAGKKAGNRKKVRVMLIIAASAVAALILAVSAFGIYITGTDTIFSGVNVNGTDLGGLTREEAVEALEAAGWPEGEAASVTILLPLGYSVTVAAEEAGAGVTALDAAIAAYNYGHGGNIFSNIITYLKCQFSNNEIVIETEVNDSVVSDKVGQVVSELTTGLMASGMEIGEDTVLVVKGAKAVNIDADEICDIITTALGNQDYGQIQYEVEVGEEVELDIEELYESVYSEAEDAYYDAETGEVVPCVIGHDFDKEQAQALWDAAGYGETIEIPLIVTEPDLTTEELEAMLFADELCTSTTPLYGSTQNRIDNVTLAASIVNGTVLKPGETFSYNGTVGQRTMERGFKTAGAYSGGQVVQEIGGGICQLSSTIYYCSLLANLQIDDRSCHYFGVSYLPPGLDATVSWKTPDFKFTNDREYPIRIEAEVNAEENSLTVRIMGTDVDGSYVKMTYASWLVYNNGEYPDIATGYKAATYRWVYDKDGNLISKELEAYSEYHYHEEDIEFPEASESPSPSVTPGESASPSPSVSPGESISPSPSETEEITTPSDITETPPAATTPVG